MKHLLAFITYILVTSSLIGAPQFGLAVHDRLKYGPESSHFAYANPKAIKGGTLHLGEIGRVDSLNPWILKGDPTPLISHFVVPSLMKRAKDEPFTVYPFVAESYEMPEDRSHIIFHLNPLARFEDGTPITADDVVYTFAIIREKGHPRYKMNYSHAKSIEKISDKSVKIVFDPQKSDRESPLILSMLPILSQKQYEKLNFDETSLIKPLSAGPYRITEFAPGQKIVLERVKEYWAENLLCNKGMNNFDKILVTYFRDDNVRLENFLKGEIDFYEETDFAKWQQAYKTPAVEQGKIIKQEAEHGRPYGMFGIALNTRRDLFKDKNVREALILLMNLDQINKNYFYGFYKPVTSFFNNCDLSTRGHATDIETKIINSCTSEYAMPSCFEEIKHKTLDPRTRLRQATELLKKAGWELKNGSLMKGEKPFVFEIIIAEKPHERVALGYADMLQKAGIKLNVRFLDSTQYTLRKEQFDFDAAIHLWGVSASPGIEQNLYWSSKAADTKGSRNYPGIKDPRIDQLIQKILQQSKRIEYVHYVKALDRVLWAQRAIIPLVYSNKDLLAYWDKFTQPTYDAETAQNLIYLFQPHKVIESWCAK